MIRIRQATQKNRQNRIDQRTEKQLQSIFWVEALNFIRLEVPSRVFFSKIDYQQRWRIILLV